MIVTIGLNLNVEKAYTLTRLLPDQINEVQAQECFAGGEAVYAIRVASELGEQAVVTGFAAGRTGDMLRSLLSGERLEHDLVPLAGETRSCLTVHDTESGKTYRLEEPGPRVGGGDEKALCEKVAALAGPERVMVLAGDPPAGTRDGVYADILKAASRAGSLTVLNARGRALAAGIEGRPHLVSLSSTQMEQLMGRPGCPQEQLFEGVLQLAGKGVEIVVLSLGHEGFFVAWGQDAFYAAPPHVKAVSTWGSSDALVAGFAVGLARHWAPEETIRTALAAATANTLSARPGHLRLIDVEALWEQVQIGRV